MHNTYIHTYIRTYIHTYIHTYMHACMHACIHMHIHIHMHMHMHIPIHIDVQIQIHIQLQIHTHTYITGNDACGDEEGMNAGLPGTAQSRLPPPLAPSPPFRRTAHRGNLRQMKTPQAANTGMPRHRKSLPKCQTKLPRLACRPWPRPGETKTGARLGVMRMGGRWLGSRLRHYRRGRGRLMNSCKPSSSSMSRSLRPAVIVQCN